MFYTALRKKRAVGAVLLCILLVLFLLFNSIPRLDTVRADLAVKLPKAECFQGFCAEETPGSTLLSRWWDFSLTYLRLVAVGMVFAFLTAGLTEAFLYPRGDGRSGISSAFPSLSRRALLPWREKIRMRGRFRSQNVSPSPQSSPIKGEEVDGTLPFRHGGVSVETTQAVTQVPSTLNLPALIMAAMVFTPTIAGARVAISLVAALLLGPVVAWAVGRRQGAVADAGPATAPDPPVPASWREALTEGSRDWARASLGYLVRLGPIMVAAGLAGGLAVQWISAETMARFLGDDATGIAVAATAGVLVNVPLLFEIPLVAVLLLLGMGTAPAATLLFAAAAGGPITFWRLARVLPRRAVAVFGVGTWALALAGGLAALGLGSLVDGDEALTPIETSRSTFTLPSTAMRFTDVTVESGITYLHEPVRERYSMIEPGWTAGGAVAEDFNGDDWMDLFVLTGGAGSSHLYINQGDGTFIDEGVERGASVSVEGGMAAGAADFDNDGDIDIVVSTDLSPHLLLINDGAGHFFVNDTMLTGPWEFVTSPSWGDVNNDGQLELILGEWNPLNKYRRAVREQIEDPVTSPMLWLYRNMGDGRLEPYQFRTTEFTERYILAPRFADVNGDRLTDLTVVADFENSQLYLNVGDGMFENVTATNGTGSDEQGMGSAIGDYDNDGDLDWFVTSIFDGSGTPERDWGVTGNRLYRNSGDGTFEDATDAAGVRDGNWGWGASFGDLDNDGDLDLYHVLGWPSVQESTVPGKFNNKPARLFENLGDGTFVDVAASSGADDRGQGRGVILFDYDNDGDLDIFITNNQHLTVEGSFEFHDPAAPTLLRNDTGNGNHWLKVTLDGEPPLHRNGIGSRVYVTVGGKVQMRELHASTNFVAQEPGRVAHFGVGNATTIDEVRAEWVNGEVTVVADVPVDQHISIRPPSVTSRRTLR